MLIKVLRSKIHRATITDADLDYIGSITIDQDLLDAVGVYEGEFVLVADIDNGERFETYVLSGPRGSGMVCINGAAARLVHVRDRVIVMASAYVSPEEAKAMSPTVVLVNSENHIVRRL
ncbi:MAG: aspartate 1-decarboxylase [Planctomycetes bacterium]|jgi:aspartate 1-decarboxylase|nr:aspartate 1-decarboxylase [Planctomycetota bacterium]